MFFILCTLKKKRTENRAEVHRIRGHANSYFGVVNVYALTSVATHSFYPVYVKKKRTENRAEVHRIRGHANIPLFWSCQCTCTDTL